MSSVIRVRPTKIELIRLRKRLTLARKVHRILRERLTILVNEFFTRLREAYRLRKQMEPELKKAYVYAVAMYSLYGESLLDYYKATTREPLRVIPGVENIMGVKTYAVELVESKSIETGVMRELEEFRKTAEDTIRLLLKLGEADEACINLGKEIKKTKRKVNALEYTLIPQLLNTIKYLRMKFEEREREEKARLKKVKSMLEKKRR